MSYSRAREPPPSCGPTPVTVCTNDVALGYLVEDSRPAVVADALRDVEELVAPVVELEHQGIALAAVDARPRAEELDQIRSALGRYGLITG